MCEPAKGGWIPHSAGDDDLISALIDPHCTYYLPHGYKLSYEGLLRELNDMWVAEE